MSLIFLGLVLGLLIINLTGLSILASRWVPYGLAKPTGVLALCLSLFFAEHFAGLGKLTGAWPITTALSLYLLRHHWETVREHWTSELAFLLGFGYALLWRGGYPDIYPSSERVTDLYFIANYLPGATLPPQDFWLPEFRFNCYYAFQHYAAALMGRIFGLDGGTTYNLAYCVITGLSVTSAWYFVSRSCPAAGPRALIMAAFLMGGTGVSPLVHLIFDPAKAGQEIDLWASMRFAGDYDKRVNTELGETLFPKAPLTAGEAPVAEPAELPVETFSYQFFIGDYHPPLGSFFLLAFSLALLAALEQDRDRRICQGLLALTVPTVIVTNTWMFPFQLLLVAGWTGYRHWIRQPPDWPALLIGGAAGFLLIYPFLAEFAPMAQGAPIRLVAAGDHTPLRQFIALHWPLMLLSLLALAQFRERRFAVFLGLLVALTLALSEVVFVDELTGGRFERTNTAMKWWSWTYAAAVIGLGGVNLSATAKGIRYGTALTLGLLLSYAYDLGHSWIGTPKTSALQLSGHRWLTTDPTNRDLIRYLSAAPPGIVMENHDKWAYGNTTTLALFSGKPALLGWAGHLAVWRGSPVHVNLIHEEIKQFYAGTLDDPLPWLQRNRVRYIVWNAAENVSGGKAFETIREQIGHGYAWKPFYLAGEYRIGLWIAKSLSPGEIGGNAAASP